MESSSALKPTNEHSAKIRLMWGVMGISVVLLVLKFTAYFLTSSAAILSDALESIINVTANAFALYSVFLASVPKDKNHPYGHGKIEFLSAGFEGGLIFVAGISILYQAVYRFFYPREIEQLDLGILITGFAGMANFLMGNYLVRKGRKTNSMTLTADGKHLISDTLSSVGLVAGLLIIHFTGLFWLDNLLAMIFAIIIIVTGYKLIRKSLAGLMDEADTEVLKEIIEILDKNKKENWIDIHNLRVVKYGSNLHIDCHITLPWYDDLRKSHEEIVKVEELINKNMGNRVEFFIHADPCVPESCKICRLKNCPVRQYPFRHSISWNLENLVTDKKHQIG